jgi:capsular exopolysaccharide synthesis family protein
MTMTEEKENSGWTGSSTAEPLTPGDVLRISIKYKKFIGATILGCLTLGLIYAFLTPPTYEAKATVKVPDTSQSALGMLRNLAPTDGKSGDPLETFLEMAESDNVAYRVIDPLDLRTKPEFKNLSLQGIVKKLSKIVQIVDLKKSNLFDIQVRSHDPQLASDMANAWAVGFIQLNLDLSHQGASSRRKFLEEQTSLLEKKARTRIDELVYGQLVENLQAARLDENTDDTEIYIIDHAVPPEKPILPKKGLSLMLALLMGLAMGIQSAFLIERTRNRVESESQLKHISGVPNYAVIPNFREDYPKGLIPPDPKERFSVKALVHNPVFLQSHYRESFKMLRTNLTLAQAGKPPRAMAFLSANQNEGKTLVNANLAITMAETGVKTLLVDVDLRKSSVGKMFGILDAAPIGIPLVLTGQGDWKKMIRPSGTPNLDLLPNNIIPPNPAELLGSVPMKKLIEEFKSAYELVIFDAAPILPVTDSVILSTLLDGIVVLVRWNVTRFPELEKALEHLRSVKAPLLGTILNDVNLKQGLYGYGGYGYGNYAYKADDKADQSKK